MVVHSGPNNELQAGKCPNKTRDKFNFVNKQSKLFFITGFCEGPSKQFYGSSLVRCYELFERSNQIGRNIIIVGGKGAPRVRASVCGGFLGSRFGFVGGRGVAGPPIATVKRSKRTGIASSSRAHQLISVFFLRTRFYHVHHFKRTRGVNSQEHHRCATHHHSLHHHARHHPHRNDTDRFQHRHASGGGRPPAGRLSGIASRLDRPRSRHERYLHRRRRHRRR